MRTPWIIYDPGEILKNLSTMCSGFFISPLRWGRQSVFAFDFYRKIRSAEGFFADHLDISVGQNALETPGDIGPFQGLSECGIEKLYKYRLPSIAI